MNRSRRVAYVILAALTLTACARADVPNGPTVAPGTASGDTARPPVQRTLLMIENALSSNFAAKALAGSSTGVAFNIPATIFNATLTMADERGRVSPFLAESLPQLDTGSWQRFPDGTMETTYQLKPNLTWHDGYPLTAEDFVFAWQVYRTPEYGQDRSRPIVWMTSVQAPDPLTLKIGWSRAYADAGKLGSLPANSFHPLPRHLLEQAHLDSTGSGEQFLPNNPFWTVGYVGAGPYKLESYNPGVSIEASAFDSFVLGRPKIDRISIRGINDVNTALVTMVAGEAHYAADMFRGDEGLVLERDWAASGGKGVILWEALGSRELAFQFRPEYAQPLEFATDVRARRALAHAIDIKSVFDAVTAGHGLMSETSTHPNEEWYPQVDREVEKYPFDLRRSAQLFEEAGFVRGSDGRWTTPRGTPFDLPIWYTSGSILFQQENAIIVDQLKQFGIAATSQAFNTQSSSNMERALLPGLQGGSANNVLGFRSSDIPKPETRWTGGNRGGYSNAEMDRLADTLEGAVAPSEILQLTIAITKIRTTDLPSIFLYYQSRVYAHAANLKGPKNRLVDTAGNATRNIHEWYWES
jgi:peptide/nickel transport system substrate-binding protein